MASAAPLPQATPIPPLPRENTFELEGSIPGQPEPRRVPTAGSVTSRRGSTTIPHHHQPLSEDEAEEIKKVRAVKEKDPAVLVNIPKTPLPLEFETAAHTMVPPKAFSPKFEDADQAETVDVGLTKKEGKEEGGKS